MHVVCGSNPVQVTHIWFMITPNFYFILYKKIVVAKFVFLENNLPYISGDIVYPTSICSPTMLLLLVIGNR
jgi:hypothetical protein